MNPIELPANFVAVVPIVAGIGNALMALPLVRQLTTRAGAARVVVVARTSAMAEPFRRIDEVDDVIVARKSSSMIRALRSQRADVVVVPFPSNRWQYSLLAVLSGARYVLIHGFDHGDLGAMHFLASRVVPAQRGIHDVIQNLNLLRAIGVEPNLAEHPRFNLRDSDRQRAEEMLARISEFVAIHCGSAKTILAKAKRWPAGSYARLIERIESEMSPKCVLLEGPDESGVCDEILRHTTARPMVLKLAGNLGEAAAVLARAAFYVGSDSGLAHLASAVGIRAVTVFAPADPDRVCPHGNRDLVVKPNKSCSPCFLYPWKATRPKMRCMEPMCINEVTVEMVMEAIHRAQAPLPVLGDRLGEGSA